MSNVPAPHFDLTSNLQLQKQFLVDLTKIPIDGKVNTDENNPISKLQIQMNSLNTNFQDSNLASNNLLLSQKDVNEILSKEGERLISKQQSIDQAITGQRRAMFLNMNYQKRYAVYTKIAVTLVIGLVIYFIIKRFQDAFPIVPNVVYTLLYIINFLAVFITIVIFYYQLSTRDLMNYDELALPPPDLTGSPISVLSTAEAAKASVSPLDVGPSPVCMGDACCGTDNYGNVIPYDYNRNLCTIPPSYGGSSNFFG
jgi:hypothetical protein